MATTYCVVLFAMMELLLLSTIAAEQSGIREKRASIPGAALWRSLATTYPQFGLQGNPDPECPSTDPHYACPEGWTGVQESDGSVCLLLVKDPLSRANASDLCQSKGGNLVTILTSERQRNVEKLLEGIDGNFWTGLSQAAYSGMFFWPNRVPMQYNNFDTAIRANYTDSCVYMSSQNRAWKQTYECHTVFRFVCALVPDCSRGWFGKYCRKECHCHGQSCQGEQPCEFGCQLGWLGPHCCTKKEAAAIAHYCMNTAQNGRHMILRVDPKAVTYDVMMPIGSAGQPLPWCPNVTISHESDGRYTITVPVDAKGQVLTDGAVPWGYTTESSTSLNEACVHEKIGENSYRWRVLLQEKKGLLLPLDRTLVFSCNFSNAESLSRGSQYSVRANLGGMSEGLIPLEEELKDAKENVALQVIDPFSGDVIKQAALGSSVALRMRLNVAQEVTAQGVAPYDCRAASSDGKSVTVLHDLSWCSGDNSSPASEAESTKATVVSKPFQLFSFSGYRDVVISCHFRLCFGSPPLTACVNPCERRRIKRKRSSGDNMKSVSTKIHILPDTATQDVDTAHPSSNNQSNGAEMMTPITWFLLLVLLLMSGILVYILFRSSRRQVRLIR